MAKKINKDDIAQKGTFQNIEESAKITEAAVKSLEITMLAVKETAKQIKASASSADPTNNKSIRERNELLKESERLSKAKIKTEKQLQKARLDELRLQKAREQAFDKFEKQRQKQLKDHIKNRKAVLDENNAYKKLTKQVNSAQARFKRLAAEYGVNSKQAIKANIAFAQLDDRLRRINKTARDGRRDVGRYGLAFREIGVSLKSLFFAGGVIGAIRGVGLAFKDAFDRVRQFDKVMQNISGVTGIARKALKSLEKSIISVAGSSIKTSNEVAELASTLFTLGNSEREVKLLLKPVNDLSIALGATSEEAADFLGQTLNAFGKGAESGQEFADIIANVRTSTSLDFQRIKDALGFVAPTANALGLSLGQVSAQIGVLQDNGIKAARAGRLLNTSFARLVKQGKTLDEALEEVNQSQDKVATATNLFGAESFTLGLILADNVEKTAELANEFDNLSEGSLKTLTDEQLKSVDAQLKILDSTYEKFILNIENGQGILSDMFRGFISSAVDAINTIDKVSVGISNLKNGVIGAREELSRAFLSFAGPGGEQIQKTFDTIDRLIDEETDRIAEKFVKKDIKTQKTITKNLLNRIKNDIKALKTADALESVVIERRIKRNQLLLSKLEVLTEVQKEGNDEIETNTEETKKNADAKKELIGLINNQSKAVSDLNTRIREATTEEDILKLSLELDVEKEELDRLKRIVSSTYEEIQKIELDLIEDTTDKRIEKEIEKSNRLIKQIETNSRVEQDVKEKLIAQEDKRLDKFVENEQIKKLQESIKFERQLAEAEIEQRKSGFKSEEDFEEFKAEQFKAIRRNELQANLDVLKFYGREEDKLKIEQLEAELATLHEFEKKKNILTEQEAENNQKIIQFTEDIAVKNFENTLNRLQEQEAAHKSNLDEYKQAARDGNISAKESLAEQERLSEEAVVAQQKIEQKKQNFLLVSSVLSAFNAELAKTDDVGKALTTAITSTTVLSQFAQSLPAFLEGTENTGNHGAGVDGKGGFHAILHDNERVLTKEQNSKIGNFTNEEVAQTMEKKRLGKLGGDTQLIAMANGVDLSGMEAELKDIKRAIIDKPVSNANIGEITSESFRIMQSTKVGNRTTTNSYKVKR